MFSISCVIIAGLSTTLQPTAAAVAAQVEQQSTPTQGKNNHILNMPYFASHFPCVLVSGGARLR